MKKYSENFERDFNWYLKSRNNFSFDGSANYYNQKGENVIQFDKKGVSGKEAFFQWDSNGKIKPTKHPTTLLTLLKTKGSVNLHIKMYAQSRAEGSLPLILFDEMKEELDFPNWFVNAVENQKWKYYNI